MSRWPRASVWGTPSGTVSLGRLNSYVWKTEDSWAGMTLNDGGSRPGMLKFVPMTGKGAPAMSQEHASVRRWGFFDLSMSIDDIQAAIGDVARQNRAQLMWIGSGTGQVQGTSGGVDYVLGVYRGRIGQFYSGTLP